MNNVMESTRLVKNIRPGNQTIQPGGDLETYQSSVPSNAFTGWMEPKNYQPISPERGILQPQCMDRNLARTNYPSARQYNYVGANSAYMYSEKELNWFRSLRGVQYREAEGRGAPTVAEEQPRPWPIQMPTSSNQAVPHLMSTHRLPPSALEGIRSFPPELGQMYMNRSDIHPAYTAAFRNANYLDLQSLKRINADINAESAFSIPNNTSTTIEPSIDSEIKRLQEMIVRVEMLRDQYRYQVGTLQHSRTFSGSDSSSSSLASIPAHLQPYMPRHDAGLENSPRNNYEEDLCAYTHVNTSRGMQRQPTLAPRLLHVESVPFFKDCTEINRQTDSVIKIIDVRSLAPGELRAHIQEKPLNKVVLREAMNRRPHASVEYHDSGFQKRTSSPTKLPSQKNEVPVVQHSEKKTYRDTAKASSPVNSQCVYPRLQQETHPIENYARKRHGNELFGTETAYKRNKSDLDQANKFTDGGPSSNVYNERNNRVLDLSFKLRHSVNKSEMNVEPDGFAYRQRQLDKSNKTSHMKCITTSKETNQTEGLSIEEIRDYWRATKGSFLSRKMRRAESEDNLSQKTWASWLTSFSNNNGAPTPNSGYTNLENNARSSSVPEKFTAAQLLSNEKLAKSTTAVTNSLGSNKEVLVVADDRQDFQARPESVQPNAGTTSSNLDDSVRDDYPSVNKHDLPVRPRLPFNLGAPKENNVIIRPLQHIRSKVADPVVSFPPEQATVDSGTATKRRFLSNKYKIDRKEGISGGNTENHSESFITPFEGGFRRMRSVNGHVSEIYRLQLAHEPQSIRTPSLLRMKPKMYTVHYKDNVYPCVLRSEVPFIPTQLLVRNLFPDVEVTAVCKAFQKCNILNRYMTQNEQDILREKLRKQRITSCKLIPLNEFHDKFEEVTKHLFTSSLEKVAV